MSSIFKKFLNLSNCVKHLFCIAICYFIFTLSNCYTIYSVFNMKIEML